MPKEEVDLDAPLWKAYNLVNVHAKSVTKEARLGRRRGRSRKRRTWRYHSAVLIPGNVSCRTYPHTRTTYRRARAQDAADAHARVYAPMLNYAACIFSGLFGGSQSLTGNPAACVLVHTHIHTHRQFHSHTRASHAHTRIRWMTRLQKPRRTRENFSISQQAAPTRELAVKEAPPLRTETIPN